MVAAYTVEITVRSVKRGLNLTLKQTAVAADLLRPAPTGLVVLAYHRISGRSPLELDLDPGLFADQMHHLADRGVAVSLDDGLASVANPGTGLAVAVTFDDGTADFVEHALPAIVASGVPVTYYVATRFIEDQVPFPDDGHPLSWAALAEAVSTGLVTVGSHTHTHAVMDKLSPAAAAEELSRSADLIEDRLGAPAHHFAYPKGVFGGQDNEVEVAARYRSAALANCIVNPHGRTDPLRLERSPIQRSDGMRFFERKARGGLSLEGRLRRTLNRRRYRSASN